MISRIVVFALSGLFGLSNAFAFDKDRALAMAGGATILAGTHGVITNIVTVSSARNLLQARDARYQSALVYPEYAKLQQESLQAEAQLLKLQSQNAAQALIDQAESTRSSLTQKRDEVLRGILERDTLRFDPSVEGRRMPESVLRARERMYQAERQSFDRIRRNARFRGVGAIGFLVSGTIFLMSASDISATSVRPSEVYDQLSELEKQEIARHIAQARVPADFSIHSMFRERP